MVDRASGLGWGQTIQACGDAPQHRNGGRATSRAVFLDRDGTLIVDKPYLADPEQIELLPRALDGLRRLQDAGYLLLIVTNQSGIARGYYDVDALIATHRRLHQMIAEAGVTIAAYYFCPHHVAGRRPELARPCPCRKPSPGMIYRAAAEWQVNLAESWLIGDRPTDVLAAKAAGCRALLVGHSACDGDVSACRVRDLPEAADLIIGSAAGVSRLEEPAPRAARPR